MEGWNWKSVHDQAELPAIIAQWQETLRSGEPWEATFRLRRHDGMFRWFLSRANPVRNTTGEITCWCGTNTDITEQLHFRDELRASEVKFRAVVETTPECVKIVAEDGTLLYMNPAGAAMVEADLRRDNRRHIRLRSDR